MQGSFDFATLFASEENAPLKNDSAKRDWLLRDEGFLRAKKEAPVRMTEEKGNDRGKGREPESVGTPALNTVGHCLVIGPDSAKPKNKVLLSGTRGIRLAVGGCILACQCKMAAEESRESLTVLENSAYM